MCVFQKSANERTIKNGPNLSGMALTAFHCISGRTKVFPQNFLTELSYAIRKSKDFRFCKYVKIIFLELKTIIAGKRINLSVGRASHRYRGVHGFESR